MATNYNFSIVRDGLIFYVDAANTKSYVSGSNSWVDISRNNGTGSLINGPTFSSLNGGSIVFDGTNDYIECGNFADNLGEMTISAWVNLSTLAGGNVFSPVMQKCAGISDQPGWFLMANQQKLGFGTQTNGSNYRYFYTTAAFNSYFNIWTHITARLTGGVNGTILFYINTVSQPLASIVGGTVTTTATSAPVTIGWKDPAQPAYLSGRVANLSIYNKALSPSEILQNYNATKKRFGL